MTNYHTDNHTQHRTMTLTGQGKIFAVPDVAVIRLGVQTEGENLTAIQSENSSKMNAIINGLKQLGISDIKTVQYTIDKNFIYEDGQQIDKGYIVRNIIEIRSSNIEQTGKIIDSSVKLGSNAVELITFDISSREYYYQQALNMSVINAIQKAESIVMNLGIKTDPLPVSITETSIMMPMPSQFQREFASTPIVPGNITIEASVTVEFIF